MSSTVVVTDYTFPDVVSEERAAREAGAAFAAHQCKTGADVAEAVAGADGRHLGGHLEDVFAQGVHGPEHGAELLIVVSLDAWTGNLPVLKPESASGNIALLFPLFGLEYPVNLKFTIFSKKIIEKR